MNILEQYIRNQSLGHLSFTLHESVKNNLQSFLQENNITLKKEFFPVLLKLYEQEGVAQQTIADWVMYDRHRVSRMLDEMEKEGLILRKPDPNSRRTNLIYLTEFSKNIQKTMHNSILKVFNKAYQGFTEKEIENTIKTLQTIINNLNQ
jgi:DNA-binding MarR family transcriptional regulator